MSMENRRCENELPTDSLHEENFDNNEVECLLVIVSDKSRATSAKKIDNISESTDTPEKIKEFPAVVVNLLSDQANQECDVEDMEQPNVDGTIKQINKYETAKNEDVPSESTIAKSTFLPKPNIELPCVQCGDIVNICLLLSHRRLHDALRKFRYAYEQKPIKLQCLVNRRLRLVKAVQESNVKKKQGSVPDNRIHALNVAFETIKLHIEGRHCIDEAVLNTPSKRRASSAMKFDSTSESTDTVESGREFPAVVVNMFSDLSEAKSKLVSKQTKNRDGHVVSSESTIAKSTFLPIIELPCVQCGDIINICLLFSHRRLHDALRKFRYAYEQKPQQLRCLVKRRIRLIKAVEKKQGSVPDNRINALNAAFEIIKVHMEGRPHIDEAVLNSSLPKAKGILMDCAMAVGLCVEGNESWKHMEDAHTYHDNFLERIHSSYLGIYDGYFGKTSAHICAENLHLFVKEHLDNYPCEENGELDKDYVTTAFKNAYQQTEKILLLKGEDERSHHRWSGCSAVTCVLTRTKCYLANLGNVGGILLRSNDVVRVLTRKHDLYDKRERDRVRKSSGVIVKTANCALINGALGVTRGIGNIGDGALRSCVINEPRVRSISLHETDQMIVLASSGLWRTFSYEEVVYIVNGFFQQINNETKKCHTKEKNNSDSESVVGRQRRYSMEVFPQENHEKHKYRYQGKHRCSLTSTHELRHIRESRGNPQVLSNRDKARFLAKSVSQRLVKSALLAGSKDNHTVFAVLLPGFCLVNLDTFTPDILTTVNAMTFNKLKNK